MSRRISIVVLHEDDLHQSFAAAFLKRYGLDQRLPRYIPGDGKAGVVAAFPTWVKGLLKQSSAHLFVIAAPIHAGRACRLSRLRWSYFRSPTRWTRNP